MQHSRLLYVEVFDFMAYEYAMFEFDETGIISFKGYNSSGKTSLLRALGIINFNMYQTKQAKLIRYGQNKFTIKETFSDGVVITREKYLNGKSAYHVHKDGEKYFSTVIDGVFTSVNEVPEYVAKYLDLIDDSNLNLHFRRGRDKLLLIDTTGRENYEFLSTTLKAEELSEASIKLKTDRLKVKNEVSAIEYRIESHKELVSKDNIITMRLVDALELLDEELNTNIDKKSQLEDMREVLEVLSQLKPDIHLDRVETTKVRELLQIARGIEDFNKIKVSVNVEKVDYSKVMELINLVNTMVEYNNLVILPPLPSVDTTKIKELHAIYKAMNELTHIEKVIADTNKEVANKKQILANMKEWLNSQNVEFYQCKDCGSVQSITEQHKHHI
ncbi:hypothetical protein P9X10_01455 [Bacillus cereus]|nr:hypothetical protein [Bacillus cereus]